MRNDASCRMMPVPGLFLKLYWKPSRTGTGALVACECQVAFPSMRRDRLQRPRPARLAVRLPLSDRRVADA